MKLSTYFDKEPKIGLVDGDKIWDLRLIYARYLFEAERISESSQLATTLVPRDMTMFIRLNHTRLDYFKEAFDFLRLTASEELQSMGLPLKTTRLLPPVLTPSKILCCGSSYLEYLQAIPNYPKEKWPKDVKLSFLKQPRALIGHRETIMFPQGSVEGDYENELAIIVGRACSDISEKDASKYIFGYSVFNDACIRDVPEWAGGLDSPRGKANDTQAPLGPWIVPTAFLGKSPNNLSFSTKVAGEIRQQGNTSGLSWTVERIVAYISRFVGLAPGDVITTGSTKGNAHTTRKFLKVGQKIECEIEGIGVLENTVGSRTWKGVIPPLAKQRRRGRVASP